jgi:hypothetical protein
MIAILALVLLVSLVVTAAAYHGAQLEIRRLQDELGRLQDELGRLTNPPAGSPYALANNVETASFVEVVDAAEWAVESADGKGWACSDCGTNNWREFATCMNWNCHAPRLRRVKPEVSFVLQPSELPPGLRTDCRIGAPPPSVTTIPSPTGAKGDVQP